VIISDGRCVMNFLKNQGLQVRVVLTIRPATFVLEPGPFGCSPTPTLGLDENFYSEDVSGREVGVGSMAAGTRSD